MNIVDRQHQVPALSIGLSLNRIQTAPARLRPKTLLARHHDEISFSFNNTSLSGGFCVTAITQKSSSKRQ